MYVEDARALLCCALRDRVHFLSWQCNHTLTATWLSLSHPTITVAVLPHRAGLPLPNKRTCNAGLALGSITERGRGTILHFDVETLYINVALGLLTTVSALRTFGVHRTVFYREASSGLNK